MPRAVPSVCLRHWFIVAERLNWFLANVNSSSRSLYAVARPSSVCRLSVAFVHPTQLVEIFGNIPTAFGTLAVR